MIAQSNTLLNGRSLSAMHSLGVAIASLNTVFHKSVRNYPRNKFIGGKSGLIV
ncbi:hypothetical protein [Nostoc sp. JL33]|uniref:hypothetical protein n=1 Tax=Nostoc sp. JL33 TaxID=2815396 RepID=UPI0025E814B9|nr:hypothetical protein [Nostoc sp. JL33]MBN3873592.1 hypothetical protein [Nostoc sp. JL33]